MSIYYWFKGFLIGFIVSAPMGPVGILCIKRVMNIGVIQGYATGLGAAIGDMFYAALAAFGLTFAIDFLVREEKWFKLIGGIVLLILGAYWLKKKTTYEDFKDAPEKSQHLGQAFSSALLLNMANVITLIVYIAVFSGFGLAYASQHFLSGASLVIGVLMGAAAWWFLLIHIVALFKNKMTPHSLVILNKITAVAVILFGLFVLATIVFHIKLFGQYF